MKSFMATFFPRLLFILVLLISITSILPLRAHADVGRSGDPSAAKEVHLDNIDPLRDSAQGPSKKNIKTVTDLIGVLVWAFPSVMGAMALLMVVVAGFLMVTAAGNDEKIERAKMHLFYIAVGMGALVSAYALINFLILRLITPALTKV